MQMLFAACVISLVRFPRIFTYFTGLYRTNKKDFPRTPGKLYWKVVVSHFFVSFYCRQRGLYQAVGVPTSGGRPPYLFTSPVILQQLTFLLWLLSGLFCLFFLFSFAFPHRLPWVAVHCATLCYLINGLWQLDGIRGLWVWSLGRSKYAIHVLRRGMKSIRVA